MRSNVGYYDREGRFLYATPSLATYVGMTPEELVGGTWYEIGVPPDAVADLEAARRRVLETGEALNRRASLVIGGTQRETEFAIKPVIATDGAIVGTVVTAWDVREPRPTYRGRNRVERAHEILSAIDQVLLRTDDASVIFSEACRIAASVGGFELAWVGLLDGDEGDVRLVSQSGRDEGLLPALTISARDDPSGHGVVGTSIRENHTVIIGNVERDQRMDAWREFFDRLGYRTAAGFPIRIGDRPIGTLALYSSRPSHFDADEARLFELVVDDISTALTRGEIARERARAQEALAASERRYRDVFNMSPHPMAVYDRETLAFLAVNETALDDFGYSREEFLAMSVSDLIATDDVPRLLAEIADAASGSGKHPSGSWLLARKDGSHVEAEVSSQAMDLDGRPARLILAIDVTERRRLEAQVAEAMRMEAMGHLAGGIAHDFNNLLTAVNGYADILIAELDGDGRAESAVEIRRAGGRAAELTKQVLAFARKQTLAPRPVDLNVAVASISQMLRRVIGEQIRLIVSPADGPVVVLADAGQLEQVLVNLAVNARDAMPAGGSLEIRVRRVDDASQFAVQMTGPAAVLTVADTGIGMDAAVLSRAFEPFFTTKEPGQGTGLGLATVHGIVRQSGGEILVESIPGDGTRFQVLLPLVGRDAELIPAPPVTLRAPARAARVLVVEDDAAVRAFIVSTLERAGHLVLVAGSAAQAVALAGIAEEPVDILVTDLVLPGGNGRELAERLAGDRPALRVVLISGYDAGSAAEAGRFLFLAKPFGADALLHAVAALQSGAPTTGTRGRPAVSGERYR